MQLKNDYEKRKEDIYSMADGWKIPLKQGKEVKVQVQ